MKIDGDYIKREDVIASIQAHDPVPEVRGGREWAEYLLEDVMSADVVEVRHGHWECEEVQCVFGKKFILTCSECGESVSVTEEALPEEHYCRSCGARMDGKKEWTVRKNEKEYMQDICPVCKDVTVPE